MTKFLIAFLGMMAAVALSVATAIHGYGLTVESWGWIIGGSLASAFLGALFSSAND